MNIYKITRKSTSPEIKYTYNKNICYFTKTVRTITSLRFLRKIFLLVFPQAINKKWLEKSQYIQS